MPVGLKAKVNTRDPENFGFADSQGCRWHGFVARILSALADELALTL